MATIIVQEKLETIQCANCAMTFAVPSRFETDRRNDHKSFYCPQGHSNSYHAESDEEKFRRERDVAKQQLARVEDEKREALAQAAFASARATAAETVTRKLKKRAAVGTCPCCQRSFANMSTHMRKQHPTFVAEQTNVIPMKKK